MSETAPAHDPQGRTQAHSHGEHDEHEEHVHVVPLKLLVNILLALLVLTFLTVAATWIDLGSFNIVLALAIALVKAAFVCLYFMHLRWDSPFNGLVLIVSLAFVTLFIGITLIDTGQYKPNIEAAAEQQVPSTE